MLRKILGHLRFPACVVSLVVLAASSSLAQGDFPPGFIARPIGSFWRTPVSLAFAGPDTLLVAESAGQAWVVDHGVQLFPPLIDITAEALNNGERGLFSVQVDPNFAVNGYLYLLLTVDPNADSNDTEQEAFARLVRYTATYDVSHGLTVDPGSRLVLLGETFSRGIPSCSTTHTIGTLRFMSDGSLVLSAGEGAGGGTDDGGDHPGCFLAGRFGFDQDIGAFRSLYDRSLAGKLLRVDPANGKGLSDNPFFTGNPDDIRSRIWAGGLRNPFRFCVHPGTGPRERLYVADVGWSTWEELDLCRGGENFGWPCYEGTFANPSYVAVDQWGFCDDGGFPHAPPVLTWNHDNPGTLGFTGRCASGLAVYQGKDYPRRYRNALFFTDYIKGWMKVAQLDQDGQITNILPFGENLAGPVAVEADPYHGDLHVINIRSAKIFRLSFVPSAEQQPLR